jgi:hypothetical protein
MEHEAAATHELTIETWREDHKRGVATPVCSCGWRAPARRVRMTFSGSEREARTEMVTEWREHLPAEHPTRVGTCVDADGTVHTGQAYVSREDEGYVLLALTTHLTPVALIVRGFEHGDVGDIEEARDYVIPVGRVRSVDVTAWWDMDDLRETEIDECPPDVAERERAAQQAWEDQQRSAE